MHGVGAREYPGESIMVDGLVGSSETQESQYRYGYEVTVRIVYYGGVAQSVRANGSYPLCHRFESCRRYFIPFIWHA